MRAKVHASATIVTFFFSRDFTANDSSSPTVPAIPRLADTFFSYHPDTYEKSQVEAQSVVHGLPVMVESIYPHSR
jgi:hypothetical protein